MIARALGICQSGKCSKAEIEELGSSLLSFYNTTDQYSAFKPGAELRDESYYFDILRPEIEGILSKKKVARVLEIGAGRPDFPHHFKDLGNQVEYHAQDVTNSNEEYLNEIAHQVYIQNVGEIQGKFDLVFSKFVMEHVVQPEKLLESIDALLTDGGVHVIFCPRYDIPGYLCPSLRHRNALTRLATSFFLACSRLMAKLDKKSRFWINQRPAVLEVENWYRDADAIHIVSQGDLAHWHRRHGYQVRVAKLPAKGLRTWILRRLLTVSLVAKKDGSP